MISSPGVTKQIQDSPEKAHAVAADVEEPGLRVEQTKGGDGGEDVDPAPDFDLPALPCRSPQDHQGRRIHPPFSSADAHARRFTTHLVNSFCACLRVPSHL